MLWYRLNMNQAARRWTFSMLFVYFFIGYKSYTGEQYSSMGRTSPLYAVHVIVYQKKENELTDAFL